MAVGINGEDGKSGDHSEIRADLNRNAYGTLVLVQVFVAFLRLTLSRAIVHEAMHLKRTVTHEIHDVCCENEKKDAGLQVVGFKQLAKVNCYLSISPITISSEPTTAGISARRNPSQSGAVGARLQKHELLARARRGLASPFPTK